MIISLLKDKKEIHVILSSVDKYKNSKKYNIDEGIDVIYGILEDGNSEICKFCFNSDNIEYVKKWLKKNKKRYSF